MSFGILFLNLVAFSSSVSQNCLFVLFNFYYFSLIYSSSILFCSSC